jgi:hypothetical protein
MVLLHRATHWNCRLLRLLRGLLLRLLDRGAALEFAGRLLQRPRDIRHDCSDLLDGHRVAAQVSRHHVGDQFELIIVRHRTLLTKIHAGRE